MDLFDYFDEFLAILDKTHPNELNRTIEDYLTVFTMLPPTLKFDTPKSVTEADRSCKKGNKMFRLSRYKDAVLQYTKSLKKAPPYSKSAASAYNNRSAALYHLKAFKDCIKDIDRALNLPCLNDLHTQIISQKEVAVTALQYATTENQTDDANIDTDINNPIDDLIYGENPKIPGASKGLDIIYTPEDGTKLVAKMPFYPGDILLIEKPFLTVPGDKEDFVHCDHCFKKSMCLIPCDQCSVEVYCSEICRTEAYELYHRIECGIRSTLKSAIPMNVRKLLFQLRCLNIFTKQGTNLKQICDDFEDIEQNSDPAQLGFTGDQFIGNTSKALFSWLPDKNIFYDHVTLFEAGYITTLLRNYTNFFKTNADVPVVAKLLMKFSEAYNLIFGISFGQIDPIAYATFPLLNLARHACVNNTITYFNNDRKMILRATQHIKPGDPILHNYHNLQYSFEKSSCRSRHTAQCKRTCTKCFKSFTYPLGGQPRVKMSKRLCRTLQKNSFDIQGLWKLLNIVRKNQQHDTLQAQVIKIMLVDAYEGRANYLVGRAQFRLFGILETVW